MEMAASTSSFIYYLLFASFALTAVVVILSIPSLVAVCSPMKLMHMACLAAVLFAGGYLRYRVVPHEFQVFPDEYDLYNSARMIAENKDVRWCKGGTFRECEQIESCLWFYGHPFLWAQAMKLAGDKSPDTGFYLNSLLGTVSILAMFMLAIAATGSPGAALFTSLFMACLPLGLLIFMRNRTLLTGCAVLLLALDMILIREDNALIIPLILLVFACRKILDKKAWAFAGAGLAAMALLLSSHWSTLLYHWNFNLWHTGAHIATGSYFQIIFQNVKFLISNDFIPPLILLLSLFGLAFGQEKMRCHLWLPAYSLLVFIYLNVMKVELWQGEQQRSPRAHKSAHAHAGYPDCEVSAGNGSPLLNLFRGPGYYHGLRSAKKNLPAGQTA